MWSACCLSLSKVGFFLFAGAIGVLWVKRNFKITPAACVKHAIPKISCDSRASNQYCWSDVVELRRPNKGRCRSDAVYKCPLPSRHELHQWMHIQKTIIYKSWGYKSMFEKPETVSKLCLGYFILTTVYCIIWDVATCTQSYASHLVLQEPIHCYFFQILQPVTWCMQRGMYMYANVWVFPLRQSYSHR